MGARAVAPHAIRNCTKVAAAAVEDGGEEQRLELNSASVAALDASTEATRRFNDAAVSDQVHMVSPALRKRDADQRTLRRTSAVV